MRKIIEYDCSSKGTGLVQRVKRYSAIGLSLILAASALSACGTVQAEEREVSEETISGASAEQAGKDNENGLDEGSENTEKPDSQKSEKESGKADEKEAEEILSYVRDWLKKTYKVSIKQNLHIIQVSQDQILKDQFSTMSIQEGTIRLLQDLPLTTVHEQLLSQMILLWQRENLSDNGDNRLAGQVPYELEQYLKHLKQYERAQRLAIHIGEKNSHEADGYRALTQELLKDSGKNSFLCLLEGRQPIPRKEKQENREKPGSVDDPHEKDESGSNEGKEDKGNDSQSS